MFRFHDMVSTCCRSCDSVLLWRQYNTLCTSGFVDDVVFSNNGRDISNVQRICQAAPRCLVFSLYAMTANFTPGRSLNSTIVGLQRIPKRGVWRGKFWGDDWKSGREERLLLRSSRSKFQADRLSQTNAHHSVVFSHAVYAVMLIRFDVGGNDCSGGVEVSQRSQRAVCFRVRAGRARRRSGRYSGGRRPGSVPAVPGRPASAAGQWRGPGRRPVPPAAVQRPRPVEAWRRLPSCHLLDEHARRRPPPLLLLPPLVVVVVVGFSFQTSLGRCTATTIEPYLQDQFNPFLPRVPKWGQWLMDSMLGWLTDHFQFLIFGHSGAQPWAPECPKIKNWKWSVIQPGIESLN